MAVIIIVVMWCAVVTCCGNGSHERPFAWAAPPFDSVYDQQLLGNATAVLSGQQHALHVWHIINTSYQPLACAACVVNTGCKKFAASMCCRP